MKTITEFAANVFKNAAKISNELSTLGKTSEEIAQALGSVLKLDGEKLVFFQSAAELVGEKLDDLKRVIVFTVNEGGKALAGATQKGEHYFISEYYASLKPKGEFKGRGGRKGKGKFKGKGARGDRDNQQRPWQRKPAEKAGGVSVKALPKPVKPATS